MASADDIDIGFKLAYRAGCKDYKDSSPKCNDIKQEIFMALKPLLATRMPPRTEPSSAK